MRLQGTKSIVKWGDSDPELAYLLQISIHKNDKKEIIYKIFIIMKLFKIKIVIIKKKFIYNKIIYNKNNYL